MRKIILTYLWLLWWLPSLAQHQVQGKIDSIKERLPNVTADSSRARLLLDLAKTYSTINADSDIKYGREALDICLRLSNKPLSANAYTEVGRGYKVKGNYVAAVENYHQALQMYNALADKAGIARIYNNLGNVYNIKQDYPEALRNYFASLSLRGALKDRAGIGSTLNNIGLLYLHQERYDEALKYCEMSRDTLRDGIDRAVLASAVDNIGDVMEHNKKFALAEQDFKQGLDIRIALGEQTGQASSYKSLGHLYLSMGKYADAEKFGLLCYHKAHECASTKIVKEACAILTEVYEKMNRYKESKKYYVEYIAARDSMFNSESERKLMEQQMQFDYEKKEVIAKAEQAKKDAVTAERLKREKNATMASLVGVALLLAIAAIAIVAFRQKRKDNLTILKLVNEQEAVIAARTRELAEANASLAHTNKQLLELIQYNAHQVREPLTRITGIMSVIDSVTQAEFVSEVWPMMADAVTDLDNNIRQIVIRAEGVKN